MSYENFEKEVIKRVQEIVGGSGTVQVNDVRKNNNTRLRGMIVLREGQNASPTIYLNSFYEMLEDGMDLDSVVKKILEVYVRSLPQSKVDMEFFKDFELVKDRIVYRLINREKNKDLLADIPHVDFLDLAICFYYIYYHPEIGEGAILIHNSHLEMWNVGVGMLMPYADRNTPQLMPAQLCTMDEALQGTLDEEQLEELRQFQRKSGRYMYVLTNVRRCFGAAAILYPGMLATAANRLRSNFYILPSSIHEMLLICDDGKSDSESLNKMIADINRNQLKREDVLSDYAYYYDVSTGKLIETHRV